MLFTLIHFKDDIPIFYWHVSDKGPNINKLLALLDQINYR